MKAKELQTELKNFIQIRDHIENLLRQTSVDERTKIETLLVFEALYNDMLAKGIPDDTVVTVWRMRLFGDVRIKIGFEGIRYVPVSAEENGFAGIDDSTADDTVINAFGDKIESRYQGGRNHLILTAKRSSLKQTKRNLIALLLAILTYYLIMALAGDTGHQETIGKYILQIEKLFTDAVLSVGGPVTFFALLRNLTSMFITAEGNAVMRKLEFNAILTSAFSVILAFCACYLIQYPFLILFFFIGITWGHESSFSMDLDIGTNMFGLIDSIVDSSIFDTFGSFAPFPLIILAILATYALCSAGTYYESINKVIDGCYVLFSKMLAAVMYTMPFFAYLAMLEALLNKTLNTYIFLPCLIVFVPVSMIIMALFYSARLIGAGVKPWPFAKKLIPLLKENLLINSTIDAVPFNTRYCVTRYGLDRKRLNESLPALARLNLDGNCFIITLIAAMFILINSSNLTTFDIAVIGVVIFFLSLGAPNQPGSTLIGMLVVISYMQAPDAISIAIFSEALFGGLLSMTNAAGDIVTVAIDQKRAEKHAEKKKESPQM